MSNKDVKHLLKSHNKLVHSDMMTVTSHVQREQDEWFLNTLMLEGISTPFKYKRKKPYQSLKGRKVNVTYYPANEIIAGMEFEYMKVVRLKIS